MAEYKKVIAVDFDGCLCESKWPEIGNPRLDVIKRAKHERENGAELVLWTCREGELLDNALEFCKANGLGFDAVNDNAPSRIELYGDNPRKVSADEYWDDRAVTVPEKSGWISVKERFPESETRNLVLRYDYVTSTPFCDILWYEKGVWWNRKYCGDFAVTHWMPLPEPPKEEEYAKRDHAMRKVRGADAGGIQRQED